MPFSVAPPGKKDTGQFSVRVFFFFFVGAGVCSVKLYGGDILHPWCGRSRRVFFLWIWIPGLRDPCWHPLVFMSPLWTHFHVLVIFVSCSLFTVLMSPSRFIRTHLHMLYFKIGLLSEVFSKPDVNLCSAILHTYGNLKFGTSDLCYWVLFVRIKHDALVFVWLNCHWLNWAMLRQDQYRAVNPGRRTLVKRRTVHISWKNIVENASLN